MTGEVADPVARMEQMLVEQAGGYLRNVIREPGRTCTVCGAPVDGYRRCYPCSQHRRSAGIADLVVPLAYGIERTQSAMALRHYKDDLNATARAGHSVVLRRMLYLGLFRHQRCIETTVGTPVHRRVTVPSLKHRPGAHPFAVLADGMNATTDRLRLAPGEHATPDRVLSATQFAVSAPDAVVGQHILILDDTWTTGSRAQSAALALRAAGAAAISIMVVGRWLSATYAHNVDFIRSSLNRDYSPRICPVTGGGCP